MKSEFSKRYTQNTDCSPHTYSGASLVFFLCDRADKIAKKLFSLLFFKYEEHFAYKKHEL